MNQQTSSPIMSQNSNSGRLSLRTRVRRALFDYLTRLRVKFAPLDPEDNYCQLTGEVQLQLVGPGFCPPPQSAPRLVGFYRFGGFMCPAWAPARVCATARAQMRNTQMYVVLDSPLAPEELSAEFLRGYNDYQARYQRDWREGVVA